SSYRLTAADVDAFVSVRLTVRHYDGNTWVQRTEQGTMRLGPIQSDDPVGTAEKAVQDAEDTVNNVVNSVTNPPPTVPSDDCVTPSATVIDGYFGSLYARLRTQGSGTATWV